MDFNWLYNLTFSFVTSLRTNFIEISLPHTLSNALNVERLNGLGFTDGSDGVRFVYYFFQIETKNMQKETRTCKKNLKVFFVIFLT